MGPILRTLLNAPPPKSMGICLKEAIQDLLRYEFNLPIGQSPTYRGDTEALGSKLGIEPRSPDSYSQA